MNNIVVIECVCPSCGKAQKIKVNSEDYEKWENGELVQRAFPYLSSSEREALITGICDNCWNSLFTSE